MDKKENKKKVFIISPILWMFTTVVWIVTVWKNIHAGSVPIFLIVLQCGAIIASFGAALADFIRYRRSKSSKSE